MSRCSICDYSQSADSIYHEGLVSSHQPNNRVVYSETFKKDICLVCLDQHVQQNVFWDALKESDNNVPETLPEVDSSAYSGCSKVEAY